jgi:ATP-binding cassette subfamily B (MDR/TAP) protein 1
LYVTIIAIVAGALAIVSNFLFIFSGQRVANRIRKEYFNSVTSQEIAFFDIKKAGALAHSLSEDISRVTDSITVHLQQVCSKI